MSNPQRLTHGLRRRFALWLNRRIPASDRLELNHRSIFILPSREGVLFSIALFAMFVGGVNYANGLILSLTYFLAALALVVILQTYRNLSGLILSLDTFEAGFVGDFVLYKIRLATAKLKGHESIEVGFDRSSLTMCAVEPDQATTVQLFLPAHCRGWQKPGRLLVRTRFPLGLIQAWSWVDLRLAGVVFPAPVNGEKPMGKSADTGETQTLASIGDFAGLNSYQTGDPLSRVYWKVLARGLPLATKTFEQPNQNGFWLSLAMAEGTLETRLSVLTYWVLKCTEDQTPFGLDLGDQKIELDQGVEHTQRCLEALALYGLMPMRGHV